MNIFPANEPNDYQAINKELEKRAKKHLKTLFFFSFFTLGFAFLNLYFFDEHNADAIISVLFNERLLLYSVITTLIFLFLYNWFSVLSNRCICLSFLAKTFRWLGECCFEFTFGLIVVYLFGFAIGASISVDSIPWLDLTQSRAYVLFLLSILFLAIALELWLFVDKNVKKKSVCIAVMFFFSAVFFLGSMFVG